MLLAFSPFLLEAITKSQKNLCKNFNDENILLKDKNLKVIMEIYFNHPALRITARVRNKIRHTQVALFKVDSALLALVNIELPLEARPPIPSPFGLCSRTNSIRKTPEIAHAQDKRGMIIVFL